MCLVPELIDCQLQGLCDASENAAAVYLRCEGKDGSLNIQLVASRSKVAPIKQVSIPRLELCGSVCVSNLLKTIQSASKLNCSTTCFLFCVLLILHAWTDSTIVLKWLVFVQNCCFVAEIKLLKSGVSVGSNSKQRQIYPFLGTHVVVRVGGRVQNSNRPGEVKHLIILPHNHHLTLLVIDDCHKIHLHISFQLTWSSLQVNYRIIRGRDSVRHFVRFGVCRR